MIAQLRMTEERLRQLNGKIAIVTGAGAGIGRAAAIELAREGAAVAVANRTPATGEETARLARMAGGQAIFVPADVSRAEDVRRLVDATVAAFGGLDILFNNAGIGGSTALADMTEEEWDRVMDVNLKGHFLCAKYAIPHMRARGGGVIINMASVLSYTALPGSSVYCATKAGILGLTRALALELARDNIRVNAVAPGSTDTAMLWEGQDPAQLPLLRRQVTDAQPVGYIGTPEQIARAVVWLASREVDFMTGATLLIDGGILARFPGPL